MRRAPDIFGKAAGVLAAALALWPAGALAGPAVQATWAPFERRGTLTRRSDLPDSVFAFPRQRKEPMTDRTHVRAAIARFDQVIGVSDEDRVLAFANIQAAAQYYGVALSAADWTELGSEPRTGRTAADRQASARKAAQTRKRNEADGS